MMINRNISCAFNTLGSLGIIIFYMKTTTLVLIIGLLIGLFGVIGLVLWYRNDTAKLKRIGKKVASVSFYWILFLYLIFTVQSTRERYVLYSEQDFWEKYNLPQIDSTMTLEYSSGGLTVYRSWSNDSILHSRKLIDYDLLDIYSVSDEFVNKKQKLELELKFIKPNLIRDSLRIYTLKNLDNLVNSKLDTINKNEFDSIIVDWGLQNKLYKKLNLN